MTGTPTIQLFHLVEPPRPCSYLAGETASLEYHVLGEIGTAEYGQWLERGWRRHGWHFFRPACPRCVKCRSLRVDVEHFQPTKSQRRVLKKNADVRVEVHRADVTDEHIRLYNAWHADMHERSGWRKERITHDRYHEAFLIGEWSFAREMRYYRGGRLIGVSLVDFVPGALSSVYFYHEPAWRPLGPGTFSILQEIEHARATGRRWLYLGYWIAECRSMAYKDRFHPHEILTHYPDDGEQPQWERVKEPTAKR